jgi:hypothetical protein
VLPNGESVWEKPDDLPKEIVVKQSTSGDKYYYNKKTKESSWTLPSVLKNQTVEARNLPEGYVAMKSKTSGETYYYNTVTQETSWEFPKVTYKKGSTEYYIERAEDRILKSLGIMTCKEILDIVSGSELSEVEQVKFIEDNAKDTAVLRKFIRGAKFTPEQCKAFSDVVAPTAISAIQKAVFKLIKGTTEPPINNDPDAEPECAILREKVKRFYKKDQGITKRAWASIITAASEAMKRVSHLTYDVFLAFYNSLPATKQILYVFQWFIDKGISVGLWIAGNPKMAYYVLLAFDYFKTNMCKAMGEACKLLEWDPAEWDSIRYLRKHFSKELNPANKKTFQSYVLKLIKPRLETMAIKTTKSMVMNSCIFLQKLVPGPAAAATSFAGLAATGVGAPVAIVGALGVGIMSIVVHSVAENAIKEAETAAKEFEQLNDIRNAWVILIDLCNPLPCILEVLEIVNAHQPKLRKTKIGLWKELVKTFVKDDKTKCKEHPLTTRIKRLYMSLDENEGIKIGEIERFLDKYSREEASGKREAELNDLKSKMSDELRKRFEKEQKNAEESLKGRALSAATNARTKVQSTIEETTGFKFDMRVRTEASKARVCELAKDEYYCASDRWVQVAIFTWLLRQGLLNSDSLSEDYALVKNITLEEVDKVELQVIEADELVETSKLLDNVDKWKYEYDELFYKWNERASLQVKPGEDLSPFMLKLFTGSLKDEMEAFLNAKNEVARELTASYREFFLKDPYTHKAYALVCLTASDKKLKCDNPLWVNECIQDVEEGKFSLKAQEEPLFHVIAREIDINLETFEQHYNQFLKDVEFSKGIFDKKGVVKTTQNELLLCLIQRKDEMKRVYQSYKGTGYENYPNFAKCCATRFTMEIEEPFNCVRAMYKENMNAGPSTFRTALYLNLMECILNRMPLVTKIDGIDDIHVYPIDLEKELTKSNIAAHSTDENYICFTIKLWRLVNEPKFFGYSNFARGLSSPLDRNYWGTHNSNYQVRFNNILQKRLELQSTIERITAYNKRKEQIPKKKAELQELKTANEKERKMIMNSNIYYDQEDTRLTAVLMDLEKQKLTQMEEFKKELTTFHTMERRIFQPSKIFDVIRVQIKDYNGYRPHIFDFNPKEDVTLVTVGGKIADNEFQINEKDNQLDNETIITYREAAENRRLEWGTAMSPLMAIINARATLYKHNETGNFRNNWETYSSYNILSSPAGKYTGVIADIFGGLSEPLIYNVGSKVSENWFWKKSTCTLDIKSDSYLPRFNAWFNSSDVEAEFTFLNKKRGSELLKYINPSDYQSVQQSLPDDTVGYNLVKEEYHPTAYRIFRSLGLPHPRILKSLWQDYYKLKESTQNRVDAMLCDDFELKYTPLEIKKLAQIGLL